MINGILGVIGFWKMLYIALVMNCNDQYRKDGKFEERFKKTKYLFLFFLFMGCTTPVAVNSDPSGARIYLDGKFQGITPLVVDFPSSSSVRLKCEKDGYRSQEKVIVQQETITHGYSSGAGYGTYTQPGRSGVGTVSNYQAQRTTQITETWPAEVFFYLRKED